MASKKTPLPKNTKKNTPAPRAAASQLDSSRGWSLAEVEPHLPAVRAERAATIKEALIAAHSNEGLIALGSDFTTEDILATVPGFAIGALRAIETLGKPPRGLAIELLPLLVGEARELERINLAYEQQLRDVSSEISGRRAQLKHANRRALRARRAVARGLLQRVLPQDAKQRAELERAAGKATTPAATVASVRTVARILSTLREDAKLLPVLDSYQYDDASVAELIQLADETEQLASGGARLTPPQKTDQRALDRQDGVVLALIRAIHAPLRDAQDDGAAITLPPLGPLERMFASTPSDDGEEETDPARPTEDREES